MAFGAPERIGPYPVERLLGQGGMGVVLAVHDPTVGQRRALKLVREQSASATARERFWREAEVLARIRHDNVITVHKLGKSREGPYLLMELVEGEELTQVCERGDWDWQRIARTTRDLADALVAIHGLGVLHRDLKPHNVIVRPDGRPVLLDFGLAREVDSETLTKTGMPLGTPYYMAPEQARGLKGSQLDARTDVYGLGALLFQLLAGEAPYAGEYMAMVQLLAAVIHQEPTWPSATREAVPAPLEAICRVAMAKEPAQRYADAGELRDDLDRYLRGEQTEAEVQLGAERVRRGARAGVLVSLALAGAVALVSLGALAWRLTAAPVEEARATPSGSPSAVSSEPAAPRPLWELEPGQRWAYRARFREVSEAMDAELVVDVGAEVVRREGERLLVASRLLRVESSFTTKGMVGGKSAYDTADPTRGHPLAGLGAGVGMTFAYELDPASGAVTHLRGVQAVGRAMSDAGGRTTSPFFASFRGLVRVAFSDRFIHACLAGLTHVRGEPQPALPWREPRPEQPAYQLRVEARPFLVSTLAAPWRPTKADRWSFTGEALYAEGLLRRAHCAQTYVGRLVDQELRRDGDRACTISWEYAPLEDAVLPEAPIRHADAPALKRRAGEVFHARVDPGLSERIAVVDLNRDGFDDVLAPTPAALCAVSGRDGQLLWTSPGGLGGEAGVAAEPLSEVLVSWVKGEGRREVAWLDPKSGAARQGTFCSAERLPGPPVWLSRGWCAAVLAAPRVAVAGFDPKGELRWKLPLQDLRPGAKRAGHLAPLAQGELLVWDCGGEFVCFSWEDAQVRWRCAPAGRGGVDRYALPTPDGEHVLLVWGDGRKGRGSVELALLEPKSGAIRWRRRLDERHRRLAWGDLFGSAIPELLVSSLEVAKTGHYRIHVLDGASGGGLRLLTGAGNSRHVAACRNREGRRLLAVLSSVHPFELELYDVSHPKVRHRVYRAQLSWDAEPTPKTRVQLRRVDLDHKEGDELLAWTSHGELSVLALPELKGR